MHTSASQQTVQTDFPFFLFPHKAWRPFLVHRYRSRCLSWLSYPATASEKLSLLPTSRRFCWTSFHHPCGSTWLSLTKHQPRQQQDVMSRKPSLCRSVFVPSAPLCHRLTVLGLFMSSAPGAQRLLGMKSRQVVFFFFHETWSKTNSGWMES